MKYILLAAAVTLSVAACKTSDKKADKPGADTATQLTPEQIEKAGKDSANFTTIEWIDSTTRNLGNLNLNEEIEVTFRFRNSGNKVLVVQKVSAGCGCTIPEQLTRPYAPGEEGIVKAKYNGTGHDVVIKQIMVEANTTPEKVHTLTFTGTLIEKKK
ncbi:MAG: DUF1573 domain-containing protein [Chitinophagaceae bacterium]|nr:DUF1573 domain-containing protein [Chitinophagaceae bacterium]